jgi:hypothetical protein
MRLRSAAREALREASTSFKPWFWRSLLGTLGAHVLVGLSLLVTNPSPMTLLGVPLIALWGLVVGALLGAFCGVYAVIVRLAGWSALIPLALIPLCMAGAWWVGSDVTHGSWAAVGDYLHSVGSGPGFPGVRAGHPIVLIILLPILLLVALPLAILVAWAMFISLLVLCAGFMAGVAVSLPPVAVAVAWRAARFVSRASKG